MEKSVVKESSKCEKKGNVNWMRVHQKKQYSHPENASSVIYLPIMDALPSVLQHPLNSYKNIQKFGFLSHLIELREEDEDIRRPATKLKEYYVNYFEDCFPSELIQFLELYKTVGGREQKKITEYKQS